MLLKRVAVCASSLAATAAILSSAGVAGADPDDPHKPDITHSFCPGGQWGYGRLGVCDGDKYPDGSYWHQWMQTNIGGPRFHYDCVAGDEPLPAPPPPGGCQGAIPAAPPPDAPPT